jgi:hypothetical protein
MPTRKVRAVSHATAVHAIDAIGARRSDHTDERGNRREDPDLAKFSDDPLELLDFVCTHQRVPHHVLAQDVLDALVVLEYVRGHLPALPKQLNRWEYWLLLTGTKPDMPLTPTQLGMQLGLGGPHGKTARQAVRARILRHQSEQGGGPRNERAAVAARRREHRERDWLTKHATRFRQDATDLLALWNSFLNDDLEEEFGALADALEEWPEPLHRDYLPRTRSVALNVRVLLVGIDALPAERRVPGDLLDRLWKSAAAHDRLISQPTP